MKKATINKDMINKKLALIILEIGKIDIKDDDISLFSFKYNLSAELLVYILLKASKEFGFEINDDFVISLGDYSFCNIVNSIINQVSNLEYISTN